MPQKTALLLVNPNSRRGRESLPEVRRLLNSVGIRFVEPDAEYVGAIERALGQHAGVIDRVIVGGGDGSLNRAAPGLLKTGLPLGVLPLGTANDFARTIGLPQGLPEAIKIIARGNTRRVDLGEANGYPFFNVASVGFSVDLAKSLTEEAKRRWGKFGYGIVAARLLVSSRLFTATLEHDGETEELRTLQVAVGNGRFYGGGMAVHADATATDGMLDFYSLEIDHWWRLLALLPSLRRGTQGEWKDVRAFSTKGLTVRTSKPHAVNLDGEIKTETPVTFSIREKAISVFTP